MSRSKKKTPISGNANGSEKQCKRLANRAFRRKEREALSGGLYEELPISMNEVSDVWGWTKDGKTMFDPERYPEFMRK